MLTPKGDPHTAANHQPRPLQPDRPRERDLSIGEAPVSETDVIAGEAIIRQRWSDVLERDPYYNPNLSRKRADFSLGE